MSTPASPILLALARLRLRFADLRARLSLTAALRLLLRPAAALRALFSSGARHARRLVRERLHGRRRALLVGIQTAPEEPLPAAGGLGPARARAPVRKKGKKKGKKDRGPERERERERAATECALRGPHHDVDAMRRLLIDKYGYHPDDIVALVDDADPAHMQPTRANILAQIAYLVKDIQDDDRLFFHYAGHADQEDTDDIEEEDGKNEYILTSDGYQIMDNELHHRLIDPLKSIKCKLTAVLDCCHSGSLLDLPHIHCNDVYVPWLNKGRRKTKTLWANLRRGGGMLTPVETTVNVEPDLSAISETSFVTQKENELPRPAGLSIDTAKCYLPTPPPSHESRAPSFNIPTIALSAASPPPHSAVTFVSPGKYTMSPQAAFNHCTGMCRDNPLQRLAGEGEQTGVEVICISASKDGELAWEDGEGRSMTQYLVLRLHSKHKPTLHNLMTTVSHDIHSYYVSELHGKARSYKKQLEKKGRRDDDPMAAVVEMHNFQNPQLSSFLPLDMEQAFDP